MRLTIRIRDPRHRKLKSAVALVLTFAAGFVDIVGVLAVYKVFTAHMTGTTVRLGEQRIRGNWRAAAVAASVIAAFLLGSILGRVLIEVGARSATRRIASATLLVELALLASVIWWGSDALYKTFVLRNPLTTICAILAMLAAAMGLQTATLTRIGPLTIHTTFVTGMLNKLGQLTSLWLFLTCDERHSRGETKVKLNEQRTIAARRGGLVFAIWLCYLAGAISGTWLGLRLHLRALNFPCLLLLTAIVADQIRPLSLEEEQEQSGL